MPAFRPRIRPTTPRFKAAGCRIVHEEHGSGASRSRPVLAKLFREIAAGDVLVVVRLDHLAHKGLLPREPHNVRDVLATHILKQTGSYEQASYAIQDMAEMVAKHYGRFLPQDKAALAAKILNQVWEAA
jgi:hypothetical protein